MDDKTSASQRDITLSQNHVIIINDDLASLKKDEEHHVKSQTDSELRTQHQVEDEYLGSSKETFKGEDSVLYNSDAVASYTTQDFGYTIIHEESRTNFPPISESSHNSTDVLVVEENKLTKCETVISSQEASDESGSYNRLGESRDDCHGDLEQKKTSNSESAYKITLSETVSIFL